MVKTLQLLQFLKNYVINLKMHGAPGTSKINNQIDKRLLF